VTNAKIRKAIVEYVAANHPSTYTVETMPLNDSLLELGVLDSFGVVELVDFLENHWSVTIEDHEITKDRMGSVNKMVDLIEEKLA